MFGKRKISKDGLKGWCRGCSSNRAREYHQENKEKIKEYREQYYQENKDKIAKRYREYCQKNKYKQSERQMRWRLENPERYEEIQNRWRQNNKEKISEASKIYRQNNKSKVAEFKKAYRDAHRDEHIEYMRQWHILNPDKKYPRKNTEENRSKYNKRRNIWRAKNPDKAKVQSERRRAQKKELIATFTAEQWARCKEHFNYTCCYCSKKSKRLTQDHFIALSRGGEYTHNNIVPACLSCNCSKNAHDFFDWYPRQSFYLASRERKILKFLNYKTPKIQQAALFL